MMMWRGGGLESPVVTRFFNHVTNDLYEKIKVQNPTCPPSSLSPTTATTIEGGMDPINARGMVPPQLRKAPATQTTMGRLRVRDGPSCPSL